MTSSRSISRSVVYRLAVVALPTIFFLVFAPGLTRGTGAGTEIQAYTSQPVIERAARAPLTVFC